MSAYPLRDRERKLRREEILERGPIIGEFLYRERLARSGIYLATILIDTQGTYGLPPLDYAKLRRVTPKGMLISGREIHSRGGLKSKTYDFQQAWFLVPFALQLTTPLAERMEQPDAVPTWRRTTAMAAG